MNLDDRLSVSYYREVCVLNQAHKISIVQHRESAKIFVKKRLDIFDETIYRFLMEHPAAGVPKIQALWRDRERNELIVIEEYISGSTLQELLESGKTGIFPEAFDRLCGILEMLHTMDPPIIHRDVKPSNLLVTSDGRLFLLDFNAAKFYRPLASKDTRLLGTEGYAAPEQYGFGASAPQTDIYALGILLRDYLAALNGSGGERTDPKTAGRLRQVADGCTRMDPSERFPSAAEVRKRFRQAVNPKGGPDADAFRAQPGKSFLPPGFRTLVPWKCFLSACGYLLLGAAIMGAQRTDGQGKLSLTDRVFFLIGVLGVIFASGNYRGVWNLMPLCRSRKRPVRVIGVLLLDLIVFILAMILMSLFEYIFA